MTPPLRLLLLRHGQSEWNAAGRWQGQADPPLTDRGIEQAGAAAEVLGGFDAIVASPLERALRTAMVIADGLGVGPVLVDADLMERDAGPWSGLTRDEIERGWPQFLDDGRRPDGYETDEAVQERVLDAIERIAEQCPSGEVLVVTHGGVVYALESLLRGHFERIPNLGGRWFLRSASGELTLGESVRLLDRTATTVPDLL